MQVTYIAGIDLKFLLFTLISGHVIKEKYKVDELTDQELKILQGDLWELDPVGLVKTKTHYSMITVKCYKIKIGLSRVN